jgi:hypothetical protein
MCIVVVYISHTMINPTIQSILLIGYAAYEKMHLLPDFVREAAHCLMVCRTAVLGSHAGMPGRTLSANMVQFL